MEQLNKGIGFLQGLGFNVVLGKNALSNSLGYGAAPQEKAEDLNRFFADPSIGAIITSQGGSAANNCLPYLDWDLIRANPKIFMGISDITVLLDAIHAKTGLVTFHGNDVMWGFGRNPDPYDVQEFLGRLVEGKAGLVKPNRPRKILRGGVAEGKLLGGNLVCLLKLAGTPYFPDFTGAVLFLEAFQPLPEHCDAQLHQLEQTGVFDQVQGVIVGYIDGLESKPDAAQMEEILLNITNRYSFPILKTGDFGHNCPNTVLPVGGRIRLDAHSQEIIILDKCVS